MKKIALALTALAMSLCAFAQDYKVPVTNINQNGYPRILEDNRVEFRLRAGQASSVQVDLGGRRYDMERTQDGMWTVTTAPQVPGYHYYSLIINGASVADPASRSFYGTSRWASAIEIPEEGWDVFEIQDVPHGQVRELNYFSNYTKSWRPVRVYTPASYEKGKKKYPVVYIHHGGGEDYRGWIEQGRTNISLDNLIAAGKAVEMIVVSVDSNVPSGGGGGYSPGGMTGYREELLNNIIPFIEKNFRVKKGPENRAMCGLSMGGGQSFQIGLNEPGVFANVASFSSGMFGGINGAADVDLEAYVPGILSNPAKFNQEHKVFYLSCGEQDPRINYTRATAAKLQEAGVNVRFNSFPGDHEWQVWRKSFHEFSQMLFKK